MFFLSWGMKTLNVFSSCVCLSVPVTGLLFIHPLSFFSSWTPCPFLPLSPPGVLNPFNGAGVSTLMSLNLIVCRLCGEVEKRQKSWQKVIVDRKKVSLKKNDTYVLYAIFYSYLLFLENILRCLMHLNFTRSQNFESLSRVPFRKLEKLYNVSYRGRSPFYKFAKFDPKFLIMAMLPKANWLSVYPSRSPFNSLLSPSLFSIPPPPKIHSASPLPSFHTLCPAKSKVGGGDGKRWTSTLQKGLFVSNWRLLIH